MSNYEETRPVQYLTPEQRAEPTRIGNLDGMWAVLLKVHLTIVTAALPLLLAFAGWLVIQIYANREESLSNRKDQQSLLEKVERNAIEIRAREDIYRVANTLTMELGTLKRDQEQLRAELQTFRTLTEINGQKLDEVILKLSEQ